MTRSAHLVGSIPGSNAEEAMRSALSRLGPYLRTLSDGETGSRSWWIRASSERLRAHPALELAKDGDYSSYDKTASFRLREGAELTIETLEPLFIYEPAFRASYPLFTQLREEYQRADLSFQVGIPSQLDYSVDSFGFPEGFSPSYYEPVLEATVRQVEKIASSGADVVFQIESPVALIAVAGDESDQSAQADRMAEILCELPARLPSGTRFGVHLCLGDMNHRSLTTMYDVTPAVLLTNALARRWPASRPFEFVHVPFAAAEDPPTFELSFYEPLRGLELRETTRFAAGCIHESLSTDRQVEIFQLIEDLVGREVDVAAACVLGRRPDIDQAWDAMEKALLLVGESS